MEKDYEDIDEIDELTDGELRALIRDRIEEQVAFDPNDVEIGVRGGVVTLSGRVGTEQELRIVEHVVTDLVGIKEVRNNLVVDAIRRAESPVAIDEHLVDEELHEGILLGDRPRPEDPEAEHLREDIRSELFGTTD
ncbi:MAG TPA: BON domain-containing protein, partial [Gemmatimonadaceae bacterium]|nr:BON domain-containing protein [Gemmatimonadaceae bacterium]